MEQQINFKSTKGNKVAAILQTINEDKNVPIIIIAHGFTSSKNGSAKVIAEGLNLKEINALRFDFFGHGESDGKFEDVTISEGVNDVLASINYLKEHGFKKIGLLGTSFGGQCAILAAAQAKDLKVLALRSPVTDYYTRELMRRSKEELNEWKSKGYRIYTTGDKRELKLNFSFLEDMKKHNGFTAAENIKIPTIIIHGDKDESVPILLSEMLYKIIPDCELKVINGADHRYSDPKLDEEAVNSLIKFIVKNSK